MSYHNVENKKFLFYYSFVPYKIIVLALEQCLKVLNQNVNGMQCTSSA